jgi:four helix bundle protein
MPLCDSFPAEETYALAQLLRTAVMSLPASLARASGCMSRKLFLANIVVAEGQLAEIDTWIETAQQSGYIAKDRAGDLLGQAQVIRRELEHLHEKARPRRQGLD